MFINRRYRHLKRLRAIVGVIWKYGFDYIINQIGVLDHLPFRDKKKSTGPMIEAVKDLSRGERLRRALTELGPTFVKLGQVLSTRHDLLPEDLTESLQKLQDDVTPVPYSEIKAQVESEFSLPLEEIFSRFLQKPLASASIGQVHEATLPSGQEVVVKVRRPGIRQLIEVDLEILFDLGRLADKRTNWGKLYGIEEMVEEFAKSMRQELDFYLEGRNAERIQRNMENEDEKVSVPKIYWEQTSPAVLTMEHIKGLKLSNKKGLVEKGIDIERLARILSRSFVKQVLFHGFFHADPHPGNVMVLPEGRLALLDFGMVSSVTDSQKEFFLGLVMAMIRGNSREIVKKLMEMDITSGEINQKELLLDVEKMRDKYYNLPLKHLRLEESIRDLNKLAFKYKVRFPSEFTVVSKALITLEGTVTSLSKEISLPEMLEPLGKEVLKNKFSKEQFKRFFWEHVPLYSEMVLEIPERIHSVLGRLEKKQLQLNLQVVDAEKTLKRVERIANRLSFSVVLLSFSIIMAGLVIGSAIGGAVPFRGDLPILEFGFIIAGAMALWLLFTIVRSGRM